MLLAAALLMGACTTAGDFYAQCKNPDFSEKIGTVEPLNPIAAFCYQSGVK